MHSVPECFLFEEEAWALCQWPSCHVNMGNSYHCRVVLKWIGVVYSYPLAQKVVKKKINFFWMYRKGGKRRNIALSYTQVIKIDKKTLLVTKMSFADTHVLVVHGFLKMYVEIQ